MSQVEAIDVPTPPEGWEYPWGNVAEIAEVLPPEHWTLIGGLMVKAHYAIAGLDDPRTTADVDMVVHLETARGRAARVHRELSRLGYALKTSSKRESLSGTDKAHRYVRGEDLVDVMRADHPAPRVIEKLSGHHMVPIDGTTQALRRTFNARFEAGGTGPFLVSVPDPYGALILKSAAYIADNRDRGRHLRDAVGLLACVDPFAAFEHHAPSQSDNKRLIRLQRALRDDAQVWTLVSASDADTARANLGILLDEIPRARAR